MPAKKEPVIKPRSSVKRTEKVVATAPTQATNKDMVMPLLIGAIIVASFGVGFLYGKVTVYEKLGTSGGGQAQPAVQAEPGQAGQVTVSAEQVKALAADANSIVVGNAKSNLVFVEFSDPSCPYCHIASGKNGELNKQAGERFTLEADGGAYVAPVVEMNKLADQGKAAYIWKFSPGAGGGELAAQAFYCAHEQGKFWPVHDLIMSEIGFDMIRAQTADEAANIAKMTELLRGAADASKMKSCLESGKYAGQIQSDMALAREFGVQGTPSFFINETNFGGAYSFEEMKSTVEAAL